MPNLVGTGLNQVPSNSMLGGMAYQNPDRVKIKKLNVDEISQINSEIAGTAVDIFIYDTSKDSDGGAWRKRTTHTSWYNETLGTATRGTRREFPAVAVIVAELTKLTIYDGDNPDLPMWMVFNLSGAVGAACNMLSRGGSGSESDITSVAFLNAKLVVGLKDVSGSVGEGLAEVNFISDFGRIYREVGSGFTGSIYNLPISGRNSNSSFSGDYNSLGIVAQTVNDVAMTVLPNAPVDSATGLPVPTIAVATDSGVSVIKDDGSVSDLYRSGNDFANSVQFTDNNSIMLVWGHASDAIRHINHYSYADWQSDQNDLDQSTGYNELPQFGSSALQSPLKTTASGIDSGVLVNLNGQNRMSAKWDDYGLKIADLNDSDRAKGMVCHIRSDSNTGWMHGDNKGAFLSDTDTTNVTGSELVVNGTFDSNANGWSVPSGSTSTLTYDSTDDNIDVVRNNESCVESDADITLEVGKTYVLTWELVYTSNGSSGYVYLGLTGMTSTPQTSAYRSTGIKTHTFTATDTGGKLLINAGGVSGLQFTLDNISLREAELDRSINKNGLQVFGTITKSAVATGADLVAYSGFSDSNYFEQPFNSAMQFGSTGDFSVSFWMKQASPATFCGIIDNGYNSSGNFYFLIGTDSNGRLFFRTSDSSGQSDKTASSNGVVTGGEWKHIVCTRTSSGTQMNMFINGVLDGNSGSVTARNVTNSLNQPLTIGNRANSTDRFFTGSLALVRVSGSAPSPEQIKKMYEDEKHLYVENSKATLYGSSDNVTAIAYDEVTEQLHVGISSGRSDFQGLRRINNTTTAVTTAISAHDEFIIEQ